MARLGVGGLRGRPRGRSRVYRERARARREPATGWRARARVRPRPRVVRMPYRGAGRSRWLVRGGWTSCSLASASQVATPCTVPYAKCVTDGSRERDGTATGYRFIYKLSMSNYESLKNPHARRVGVLYPVPSSRSHMCATLDSCVMTHETCEAMAEACFRFRSGFSHGHRSASLPPPTVSSPLGRSGPRETGSGPGLRRASSPRSSCPRCCG